MSWELIAGIACFVAAIIIAAIAEYKELPGSYRARKRWFEDAFSEENTMLYIQEQNRAEATERKEKRIRKYTSGN